MTQTTYVYMGDILYVSGGFAKPLVKDVVSPSISHKVLY